jgi:hypothetical protein
VYCPNANPFARRKAFILSSNIARRHMAAKPTIARHGCFPPEKNRARSGAKVERAPHIQLAAEISCEERVEIVVDILGGFPRQIFRTCDEGR